MGNKSSRDTRRRVAAARERQAKAGEYGGGPRPFGFEEEGLTIRRPEADVIADCSVRVVQGASMRSLCRELNEQGVLTTTGKPLQPDRWLARRLSTQEEPRTRRAAALATTTSARRRTNSRTSRTEQAIVTIPGDRGTTRSPPYRAVRIPSRISNVRFARFAATGS